MKYNFSFTLFSVLFMLSSTMLSGQPNLNSGFPVAKHGTYVIAHRGAHNGIPENSIPAYQKAIELGCDFV